MEVPLPLLTTGFVVTGLAVGSFLNVCIHRYGIEGETIAKPVRSRCPKCRYELTWRDNIPVLSWILLGGRCRSCKQTISLRYPLVELLTGGLFGLALAATVPEGGPTGESLVLALVYCLVLAALVVATFVDFDHYEIPDGVSIGGMWVAPVISLLVPALHRSTWVAQRFSEGGVDRTGAFLGSLAGIVVGAGVIWLIGALGSRAFGREAMGFGDVKLLGAGGGFVGPGGALAALLIGSFVASIAGVANMARFAAVSVARTRRRGRSWSLAKSARVGHRFGRELPFGPYLGIGVGIALLGWNHVLGLWSDFVH